MSEMGQRLTIYARPSHVRFSPLSGRTLRRGRVNIPRQLTALLKTIGGDSIIAHEMTRLMLAERLP